MLPVFEQDPLDVFPFGGGRLKSGSWGSKFRVRVDQHRQRQPGWPPLRRFGQDYCTAPTPIASTAVAMLA